MRRVKNGLLVVFTLLLVVAGAVMPGVAGYLQDSYGASMQETRSFDSFSLTLRQDSELAQVLRLLVEQNYVVVDWDNHTAYNKKQAEGIVEKTLQMMYKYGLMEDDALDALGTPHVEPCALAAYSEEIRYSGEETDSAGAGAVLGPSGGELYAVAWDCQWRDEKGRMEYMLRIDDETGKILMAFIRAPVFVPGEEVYDRMDHWKNFVEDHYGFEVTSVAEMYIDVDIAEFIFYLDLEDGGEPLTLCLQMSYDMVYLAPCAI